MADILFVVLVVGTGAMILTYALLGLRQERREERIADRLRYYCGITTAWQGDDDKEDAA